MPAGKKSTAVSMPAFTAPMQFGGMAMPSQFGVSMIPYGQAQMQFSPPASIPTAQPVAPPASVQTASQSHSSAIELMEQQMKTMKEYIANMEKTFKEAKKGMKKPKVPKDPSAPKKAVPAGTQQWNEFVELVQKEESDKIRASDPTKGADWKGITRKQAMAKAKELKAAGDPRYTYVKKEKPTAVADPAGATDTKKRGRKPKAIPAPVLPPTGAVFASPVPLSINPPAPTPSDDSIEVEEKEINGITYLMTAKNECWQMLPNGDQGPWAGIYNGSVIVPAPEPM